MRRSLTWLGRVLGALCLCIAVVGCLGVIGSDDRDEVSTVEGAQTGCNHAALFGMNIDPPNPAGNPSAAQLADRGVRWVRIEYKPPAGQGFYDSTIASLRQNGIQVLLLVDYWSASRPALGDPPSAWHSFIANFAAAAGALAQHYGDGVDAWQLWNEPDLPPQPGYDPHIPAQYYGELLKAAYGAVRQHSSRPIVTGGLASGNPGYLAQARDAAGGLWADGVSVHPYGQRAPDNWPNSSWGFGNMSALFNNYLQFGKPLWVTEIGTVDQGLQAQYLENVYALAESYGSSVAHVFWFCWSDGMVAPHGLLDGGGQPKASWHAYRNAAPSCNPSSQADVTVTDLWWTPSNPQPGQQVQFHARVKNQGGSVTGDIVGVGFKVNGAQHNLWWDTTAPMGPGAEHDFHMQTTWQLPGAGSYSITAHADDINRFPESDENNNALTKTLSSGGGGGADVTVLDLWWTPAQPNPGDQVQLHAKVKNQGNATTGDIVGVGFKVDGVQQNLWWDTTGPMAPGQEHDFHMQTTWQVPGSGSYTVTAHADDIDRFAESDEGNNVRDETLTVGSQGGGFPCDPSKDNCCHYPPQTGGVPATFPGGLCDPNGDGSYADADWSAGWYCYQQACGG